MNYLWDLKKKIFSSEAEKFIEIIPRIYTLNFPSKEKIESLQKNFLQVKGEYKIWNISEYTYNPKIFDNNVVDYCKPGYPNPCLQDFFIMFKEMSKWLDSNPQNLLFIHCQKNFSRTSLILICFLFFLKHSQDFVEIQNFVFDKLNSSLLNNQKLYLKYIESAFNNVKFNKHPIRLKKLSISEIPFIRKLKEHAEDPVLSKTGNFKPYIQIFKNKEIVYNSFERYF